MSEKKKTRNDQEWLEMIQECRASDLSDREWRQKHSISIKTFHNKVSDLRKKAYELPKTHAPPFKQEVVPVALAASPLLCSDHPACGTLRAPATSAAVTVRMSGYSGYNKVEDVILAVCSAHCRRKFYEALPAERKKKIKLLDVNSETDVKDIPFPDPEQMKSMIPAEIGLVFFNKLFFIEKGLKGMEPEQRREKRMEKEAPVWEKFWAWIETLNPLGGSKLEKAVNYALNHKETLCNYLQDGRCELSNNAAERRAKAYAIGRKNSLFHTSVAGANASALVYSMIETAKANKLNVFQYIYVVLLYMPEYKDNPDAVKQLLPWSDYIKEHCKGLIDVEAITPENKPPLPL